MDPLEALRLQALAMQAEGLCGPELAPLHQARVELVGGPADGTVIDLPPGKELKATFRARGRFEDDGSGEEVAEYRRQKRVLMHNGQPVIDAAPIIFCEFAGMPVR